MQVSDHFGAMQHQHHIRSSPSYNLFSALLPGLGSGAQETPGRAAPGLDQPTPPPSHKDQRRHHGRWLGCRAHRRFQSCFVLAAEWMPAFMMLHENVMLGLYLHLHGSDRTMESNGAKNIIFRPRLLRGIMLLKAKVTQKPALEVKKHPLYFCRKRPFNQAIDACTSCLWSIPGEIAESGEDVEMEACYLGQCLKFWAVMWVSLKILYIYIFIYTV